MLSGAAPTMAGRIVAHLAALAAVGEWVGACGHPAIVYVRGWGARGPRGLCVLASAVAVRGGSGGESTR